MLVELALECQESYQKLHICEQSTTGPGPGDVVCGAQSSSRAGDRGAEGGARYPVGISEFFCSPLKPRAPCCSRSRLCSRDTTVAHSGARANGDAAASFGRYHHYQFGSFPIRAQHKLSELLTLAYMSAEKSDRISFSCSSAATAIVTIAVAMAMWVCALLLPSLVRRASFHAS